MNREILKKAGELSGIEVNYFGEIINSKMRKFYNSIKKAEGQNLKVFRKLVKETKKMNICDITVLKCDEWIGEYGLVARDINIMKEYQMHYSLHENVRYIYNVIRGLHNSHKRSRYLFVPIETVDDSEAYHLFYIPENFRIIKYGPNDNEILINMANGQYFDIGYSHYYSKKDSRILRKEMKKGYVYECPSYFYKDFFTDDEYYDSSDEGSPE